MVVIKSTSFALKIFDRYVISALYLKVIFSEITLLSHISIMLRNTLITFVHRRIDICRDEIFVTSCWKLRGSVAESEL